MQPLECGVFFPCVLNSSVLYGKSNKLAFFSTNFIDQRLQNDISPR